MSEKTRKPATFKLDDANVVVVDAEEPGRIARGTVRVMPETEPERLPVPLETRPVALRTRFGWGTLFWSATAGLVVLGAGLGVVKLIEDLFARNDSLGWLGLGLAASLTGAVEAAFWFVALAMFASGALLFWLAEETHPRLNPATPAEPDDA